MRIYSRHGRLQLKIAVCADDEKANVYARAHSIKANGKA